MLRNEELRVIQAILIKDLLGVDHDFSNSEISEAIQKVNKELVLRGERIPYGNYQPSNDYIHMIRQVAGHSASMAILNPEKDATIHFMMKDGDKVIPFAFHQRKHYVAIECSRNTIHHITLHARDRKIILNNGLGEETSQSIITAHESIYTGE